jgi:hypothetical protein
MLKAQTFQLIAFMEEFCKKQIFSNFAKSALFFREYFFLPKCRFKISDHRKITD